MSFDFELYLNGPHLKLNFGAASVKTHSRSGREYVTPAKFDYLERGIPSPQIIDAGS